MRGRETKFLVIGVIISLIAIAAMLWSFNFSIVKVALLASCQLCSFAAMLFNKKSIEDVKGLLIDTVSLLAVCDILAVLITHYGNIWHFDKYLVFFVMTLLYYVCTLYNLIVTVKLSRDKKDIQHAYNVGQKFTVFCIFSIIVAAIAGYGYFVDEASVIVLIAVAVLSAIFICVVCALIMSAVIMSRLAGR